MTKTRIAIVLWIGSAIGAVIWLGFFSGLHVFRRSISQDDRDATAVMAVPLPTQKVKVVIRMKDDSCVHVERATIESDTFRVYVVRTCGRHYPDTYWELHIKQKAQDGTVIQSWYMNHGPSIEIGEHAEMKTDYFHSWSLDPRTATVEVYASSNE